MGFCVFCHCCVVLVVHQSGQFCVLHQWHLCQCKYLCHGLGPKWVEYLTSFNLSLPGSSQVGRWWGPRHPSYDPRWKSSQACSVLRVKILTIVRAEEWALCVTATEGRKLRYLLMGLHFIESDAGSHGFPKNNKAVRCSWDLLISFDFHPHEVF